MVNMLFGEYRSKVTSGNRVALPRKFRVILGNKIIITQGYEDCLVGVSLNQWKMIIKEAASGPFVSKSVRDTSRFLLGSAHNVGLDRQGRFVIPESLREYAGIEKEVAFLGLNRWIEIWNVKTWEKRKKYIKDHSSEIAKRLEKLEV